MKPFIALYTERPDANPALLLVFANRDIQTAADVAGTRQNLEAGGEGVHIRDFDLLKDIPDVLAPDTEDASAPAKISTASAGSCLADEIPVELINRKYPGTNRGDTYQNGVKPGPQKLAQFIEVLKLAGTPALYAQENNGDATKVHVKLFDPAGSWTWFITEFSEVAPDGVPNLAFGLVDGHEAEMGYIDLNELANVRGGMGIGIEIDMHFKPQLLKICREQ